MERKKFIEIMNSIEKNYREYHEKTRKIGEALSCSPDFIGGNLIEDTIKVLQQIYPPYISPDGNVYCDIEYYIYELDFGKVNCATSDKNMGITLTDNGENKREIFIKNAGELWDFLHRHEL
jgi:hypothetical protein